MMTLNRKNAHVCRIRRETTHEQCAASTEKQRTREPVRVGGRNVTEKKCISTTKNELVLPLSHTPSPNACRRARLLRHAHATTTTLHTSHNRAENKKKCRKEVHVSHTRHTVSRSFILVRVCGVVKAKERKKSASSVSLLSLSLVFVTESPTIR